MIAPETLLKLYPLEALRRQAQEVLKKPLRASYLRFGPPTDLGNLQTGVVATLDKSNAPVDLWDRVGDVSFEYTRIDMAVFTQTLDKEVKVNLPTDPRSVFQAVLSPYAIPVDDKDVIDARYTAFGNSSVLANESSYRWVGELEVRLVQLGFEIESLIRNRQYSPPFNAAFHSLGIKELLTFYMNSTNIKGLPVAITSSMFEVGSPTVNGPILDRANTQVDLVFSSGTYQGTVPVTYMRRGFDNTFRAPVRISGPNLNNMQQLAGAISLQIGCTILSSDIASAPFPTLPVGKANKFVVNIDHNSLAYVGDVMVEYTRTS